MGIDTVALRSPYISEKLAQHLENQSIYRSGVELSTGKVLYEFTTGSLAGSFDSRIRFVVKREEFTTNPLSGAISKVNCPPFIEAEASVHKFRYGQNVYGDTTGFQSQVSFFLDSLSTILNPVDDLELDLPEPLDWTVTRVDWSEMHRLNPQQIADYIHYLSLAKFPRRQAMRFGQTGVYFPGTVTIKFYHKGPEFKSHDAKRVRDGYKSLLLKNCDTSLHNSVDQIVSKKIKALQRLADNRLRTEAEIHAEKLRYDFGHLPTVAQVTDDYLKKTYHEQFEKLLKEGAADMETVRNHDAVKARLNRLCPSKVTANKLLGFWMRLVAEGEERLKEDFSKATICRNKKILKEYAISWVSGDVYIVANQAEILEFSPLKSISRRCNAPVRTGSVFNLHAIQYRELKAA